MKKRGKKDTAVTYNYTVDEDFTLEVIEDPSDGDVEPATNLKTEYKADEKLELDQTDASQGTYKCYQCGHVVSSVHALYSHHKSHPKCQVFFKCPNCVFTTTVKAAFSVHVTYCVPSETKHKCTHCSFITLKLGRLNKHLRSNHSKNPVYICSKCPFQTDDTDYAEKHKLKHDPKKLKCDLCNYETVRRTALQTHKLKKHTDQKFRCDLQF